MPIALNAAPIPTGEAAPVATGASATDPTGIAADAFAMLLLAAGGETAAASADKDAITLARKDRLPAVRNAHIPVEETDVPTRPLESDRSSPIESTDDRAPLPDPSPGANPFLDFAAMTAASSMAIASRLKADTPSDNRSPSALPPSAASDACAITAKLPGLPNGTIPDAISGTPGDGPRLPSRNGGESGDAETLSSAPSAPPRGFAPRASEASTLQSVKDLPAEPAARPVETVDAGPSRLALQSLAIGHFASASAPPTVHAITTPVNAPGWEHEFAGALTQVVLLRDQRAQFHLNPAALGPVEVQISFASDQAVVLITAANAATREALEQALPYLRDMLAGQGIALGQASVQGERNPADRGNPHGGDEAAPALVNGAPGVSVRAITLRGLVDVFA